MRIEQQQPRLCNIHNDIGFCCVFPLFSIHPFYIKIDGKSPVLLKRSCQRPSRESPFWTPISHKKVNFLLHFLSTRTYGTRLYAYKHTHTFSGNTQTERLILIFLCAQKTTRAQPHQTICVFPIPIVCCKVKLLLGMSTRMCVSV